MTIRKESKDWWKSLSSTEKTTICDKYTKLLGQSRRWESFTGKEIEFVFESYFSDETQNENYTKNKGTQRSPFGIGS